MNIETQQTAEITKRVLLAEFEYAVVRYIYRLPLDISFSSTPLL
jgi:hypothetical protein